MSFIKHLYGLRSLLFCGNFTNKLVEVVSSNHFPPQTAYIIRSSYEEPSIFGTLCNFVAALTQLGFIVEMASWNKLIILLALLVGVLYCLHLLVRDYQSLSAGRFFSFLSKRDTNAQNYSKPNVRWKKILQYDPLSCARTLFCDLGARPPSSKIRKEFILMLTLEPREEDKSAQEEFIRAYNFGRQFGFEECRRQYNLCPFKPALLFEVVQFLITNPSAIMDEPERNWTSYKN